MVRPGSPRPSGFGAERKLGSEIGSFRLAPIPAIRISADERVRTTISGHSLALLDDLVGASEDRWRYRHAELLRGLDVDDQLECGRLLDRQISRLRALEDFSGVAAVLAIDRSEAGSILIRPPATANSRHS